MFRASVREDRAGSDCRGSGGTEGGTGEPKAALRFAAHAHKHLHRLRRYRTIDFNTIQFNADRKALNIILHFQL